MGWNVLGSITGTHAFGRQRSKETGSSTTTTEGQFSRNATFRPEAQGALDALSGLYGNVGQSANQANRFYFDQVQGSGVNPYIENMVAAQNQLSNQDFSNRLAQVRSGGFRGGVGRDTINQGNFASNYTAQQYANNQNILANAFTQAQNERFAAANALSQNQQLAMQLLALLRGEEGQESSKSVTDYLKYYKGQSDSHSLSNTISGGFGMSGGQ